jgi:hypothetical protein
MPGMRATWKPHEKHGRLTTQSDLPDSVYAFPKQRKEPMTDGSHVRNAIARMDQVEDVSPADRDLAFANIQAAAKYYGVDLSEESWHDVGIRPQPRTSAARGRKKAARKKTTARKVVAKRTVAKKATAKKTSAKKTGAKKAGAKKTSAKRTRAKKTARKR